MLKIVEKLVTTPLKTTQTNLTFQGKVFFLSGQGHSVNL